MKATPVRGVVLGGEQVEGRRAVREVLAAGRRRVRRVWIAQGQQPSAQLDEIERLAVQRRVRLESVRRSRLDAVARTEAPQGVVAFCEPIRPVTVDDLLEPAEGVPPFLLAAAGITDPRNLGSVLRSAECAGVTGVLLPRHRAAHLTPGATKVAAGAIEHLAFAVVGGMPAALTRAQAKGIWVIGLAGDASQSLYDLDLGNEPVALVVGNEERGLARLVRRRCDVLVAIPHEGALPSLNVAAAAAVGCFEVARQRRDAASSAHGAGAGGRSRARSLRRGGEAVGS